jgi:dihydrofolate reductase
MKVVLVFVSTVDGKVTRWGQPHVKEWTSAEDQKYYKETWNAARVIVMGRKTFEAETYQLSPERLILVMTSQSERFKEKEVAGQLEFTNHSPAELVQSFAGRGIETMLVVGGPHVATSFLKAQLVDELWLTIEPRIFGSGDSFATDEKLNVALQLLSCERANETGTMITKYKVLQAKSSLEITADENQKSV